MFVGYDGTTRYGSGSIESNQMIYNKGSGVLLADVAEKFLGRG